MRAKSDIKLSHMLLNSDDDYDLLLAAYHVQQAAEKLLKSCLKELGINYTKTHDISSLLNLLPENQDYFESQDLVRFYEKAPLLSEWESKARYVAGYLVRYFIVKDLCDFVSNYIKSVEEKFTEIDKLNNEKSNIDSSVRSDADTPDWLNRASAE